MTKYALIFPGQGAQKAGMGKDLYDNYSAAKNVFKTADEVLGYSISDLCFNGTDEDLMKTINSQPAILTVSLAAYEALREVGNFEGVCTAGHSLGEYAALYAAGAVDLKTVLLLISKRAYLMNEAANKTNGLMAAVIGLPDQTVIDITNGINNVYVANFNSPGQVVITGDKDAITNHLDNYKEAGAKKVIPLAVSGAFHSPLMQEAAREFEDFVKHFEIKNSYIPVYTNVDAKSETQGDIFKEKLPKQIYSSVLWTQTINNILNTGVNNFIEIGPGKVLAGLNRKINPEIKTLNVYDNESLNITLEELLNNREKEFI